MPPDLALQPAQALSRDRWTTALVRLACAWLALFALMLGEWQQMVHQWWAIDTYGHILLIPPIIAWLAWARHEELAKIEPQGWWPGLAWLLAGLCLWLGGTGAQVNLVAQVGTIVAFQGALAAAVGIRAVLILAFPLAYALFLVPFGDEIIPPLQDITARITVALTHASGIAATVDGINIYTPAGLFIVAEACSGVKFLIAMVALGTLVAWTCFKSWSRRGWLMLACVIVPIIANGIRAWATIYVAQFVGAEAAGSFDHIVYGWIFFAIVVAMVLGVAWRWFERDPEDAGIPAADLRSHPLVCLESRKISSGKALTATLLCAFGFAVAATLV